VLADRLFTENHEALRRYLTRFTGDPDTAADLVQETFVRLLEHRPDPAVSRAWLFRVATNLARDALRRRRRHWLLLLRGASRAPHGDPPPSPDRGVEAAERGERARAALLRLSERERTALLMREEGFRHHEIAETLGVRPGTVGVLLMRAIRKLSDALGLDAEEL
jgi:RNA polymerase sigma factor (sigma-70 family)